ncbi:MAG: hypothetical protein SCH70_07595 [Candidatus Methanoperedens sp.]|nr:hypothetical protein [Candidatus Methanoperedens sp.]
MTNIDAVGMLLLFINFSMGILMIAYIAFRSVTEKQFGVMAGLLAFIFGTYFIFSVVDRSQDFLFVFAAFGIPAVAVHVLYKNIRESSMIAFVGTIFAAGFELATRAGTMPRLSVLLASTGVSFALIYIYNKNITRSIIGSLIGLAIISALLLIISFTFFEFGFNLFLSTWVSILLGYGLPIFTGVAVIKLIGYGVQVESDERTSASAARYSWFMTLTVVGVLILLTYFIALFFVPLDITFEKMLGIVFLVTIGTLALQKLIKHSKTK